jgi:hypothetical protein
MKHEHKILLALDAILVAAAGWIEDPELRDSISDLQDVIEARAPQLEKAYPTMEEYVAAQKNALEELIKDPRVFGN